MATQLATAGQGRLAAMLASHGSLAKLADHIEHVAGKRPDRGLLGRWARGEARPGPDWRALLAAAGIAGDAWDRAPSAEPVAPPPRLALVLPLRQSRATPAAPPATVPRAPPGAPRAGRAPRTVAELQERLREIPGELADLGVQVEAQDVSLVQATEIRRCLDSEARALRSAIEASGTATVEEVSQLRALLLDVTRGCDTCRARVTAGLRASGAT